MKINSIKLQNVHYMPADFEAGILYVSKNFGIAGHLCACGCGNKIMTPLGPAEWYITNNQKGVSVWPSIGNGQLQCKSHYIIRNGKIIWCQPIDKYHTFSDLKKAEFLRNLYYNKNKKKHSIKTFIKTIYNMLVKRKI